MGAAEIPKTTAGVKSLRSPKIGYLFMVFLAVQYGLQPSLTKLYRPPNANTALLVLCSELTKVLYSLVEFSTRPKRVTFSSIFNVQTIALPLIPGAIYTAQNYLMQIAYSILDSISFNCVNQSKLVFSALCLYIMFNQKQSYLQVLALMMILASSLVLQIGDSVSQQNGTVTSNSSEYMFGMSCVFGASCLSALAGALVQHILQRPNALSVSELNFVMGLFSGALLIGSLMQDPLTRDYILQCRADLLFAGWTWTSCIPIVASAFGGICVGQVAKHLGTVAKGIACVFGLILTGFVQPFMGEATLKYNAAVALVLVVSGTALHIRYPYVDKYVKKD